MFSDPRTIILLGVIIFGPLSLFIFRFSLRQRLSGLFGKTSDNDAGSESDSQILSFFTAGHLITRLARTTAKGMKYSVYMTLPYNFENAYVTEDAAVMVLDLPYNTQTHLVGLSKQHNIDRLKFEEYVLSHGMEKVVLEGDFQDYFELYATKGQQFQARYVLNPEAMEFLVDYCKHHFWEINSSEFYIAVDSLDNGNDDFIEESLKFADVIKPALLPGDPSAPAVHHEIPYGEYDGPPLECPICKKPMSVHDNWQLCPQGHGLLLNGRDLSLLRQNKLSVSPMPNNNQNHAQLTCPFCGHKMEQVGYEETNIKIDSCTFCTFRWLDADEVAKIAGQNKQVG